MAGEILPTDYASAQPILDRFIREQSSIVLNIAGTRRRPDPPRSLIFQGGSLEGLITWNAPQNFTDITGWRIYKDTENNLLASLADANARSYKAKMPADTNTAFYVSAINGLGVESIKVQIIGKANTDQYVVTGTGGGTGGTSPSHPPGYSGEPTGGGVKSRGPFGL